MGLINWIFDFYQQHRLERLRDEVAVAAKRGEARVDVARLERALGELALAAKTLQRIAVEKGLCTPEEFRRMLDRIDAEDGRTDGSAPIG